MVPVFRSRGSVRDRKSDTALTEVCAISHRWRILPQPHAAVFAKADDLYSFNTPLTGSKIQNLETTCVRKTRINTMDGKRTGVDVLTGEG
jgi:hypothetical protein